MVVHIVMFKFKEKNKEKNILKVKKMLEALIVKIDSLLFMEVGINFDESERAFDLCLYSKFETKDDLKAYGVHKEHLKVVTFIKSVTLESKVVDYTI